MKYCIYSFVKLWDFEADSISVIDKTGSDKMTGGLSMMDDWKVLCYLSEELPYDAAFHDNCYW